jgi:HEAT repeat protein
MNVRIAAGDFEALVKQLGDPIRAKQAFRHLIGARSAALEAVRNGLTNSNGDVRMHCVRALDHLVDEDAWPAVIAMLGDPDPRVRVHALHAIACDRCKDAVCRPAKADVLPRSISMLREDPSYHVRLMAVEVVGGWIHEDREAAAALSASRDEDPAPVVRKKARWYAPGGVIFLKTSVSAGRRRANRDPS